MLKIDTKHQPVAADYMSPLAIKSAHCLLVPIPNAEIDLTGVTRRVWKLANATGAHVKFIALCNDSAQEPGLRRVLVTLSAMVNAGNVSGEAEVVFGKDWVDTLKSRLQTGDMVVCLDEPRRGLLRRPLRQILQSDLDVPLYILSGLDPQHDSRSGWLTVATWTGFIAIIVGFFLLQVKITDLAADWTLVLELLTTAVEFWLIWFWNNLLG
ncbi:MAG: hypothetical protein ABI621_13565 [Chloroflexota bacterium]